ncbi:MAG: hypothetical protein JWN67_2707 [Actinomycetia bacterium]|nr:hypothetical protein [Actinomycetes bacterium]
MRRLALLLVPVLLVVGCGGGGMGGGDGGSADLSLTYAPDPLVVGPVTWTLTIENLTDSALKVTFPTGQRGDVTLVKDGETAYQWSRGQMFTQEVSEVTVDAGMNKAFTLAEPGLDVDPGEYTLTATLASPDHQELKVTRQVTVNGH